jgi:hypothetical protein
MSYDTNWAQTSNDRDIKRLKTEADKLARIACKAMTALEEMEKEDFLLLKDEEVREWWAAHKEADRKERARVAEAERKERVKAEALASLSDEAKELLGLAKHSPKKKVAGKKVGGPVVHSNPIEDYCEDEWERQEQEFVQWEREIQEELNDLKTCADKIMVTYKKR